MLWQRKRGTRTVDLLDSRTLPVDIEALLSRLSIRLEFVNNPGWDGALMSNDQAATIWVRSDCPRERQRFTMAHELGHLLRHPLGVEYIDIAPDTVVQGEQDLEANAFASALLMPRFKVQPMMYEGALSVSDMAKLFGVSVPVMGNRLDSIRQGVPDV